MTQPPPETPPRDTYVAEEFTDSEAAVLRRHFTNLDQPVFALVNLPEVVKGALFARYSRTHSSLRRLFLDEFASDVADIAHAAGDTEDANAVEAGVGVDRAQRLYDRVFFEYGDDSVAQLGGVHLACEQASNLLTKVLEWGRLMSYLEQSTRYIVYDRRIGGRYRYHRPPEVLNSALGARFVGDLDRIFEHYTDIAAQLQKHFMAVLPHTEGDSELAHRRAVRARALDGARGVLPAATLSNVGIYGSGQAYEALLLRMRSHPLPEARTYAAMILSELRKVIPSFLRRVDLADRGVVTSAYLAHNRAAMDEVAAEMLDEPAPGSQDRPGNADTVELVDFDPEGEEKIIAAMLYPHSEHPEREIRRRVRNMTQAERVAVVRAYCGDRTNRRHKPGRALERTFYHFDVLSDYGAFRDLQRHRMMSIEWQPLSVRHGYATPAEVTDCGADHVYATAMQRSAELYEALRPEFPHQAPYAVALAYRVRYSMHLNAREAMHMIELRTQPAGHPSYRWVCSQMHRRIAEVAGHTAVAEMMRFVDHTTEDTLGRLAAEIRTAGIANRRSVSNIRPHPNTATSGDDDRQHQR